MEKEMKELVDMFMMEKWKEIKSKIGFCINTKRMKNL